MLDYALRRRFAFFEFSPAFETEGFRMYRQGKHNKKFDNLVAAIEKLNVAIENDDTLGRGFRIGHSYFCTENEIDDMWLNAVITYEIVPLLNEYWFDEPSKVRDWEHVLREAIQNIYYMLAYAFQVLREQVYKSCGTEEFENTADLLSAILAKGVATQIKRGLGRTYIEETEPLSCLRGKIRVTESIKQQTLMKQQLICTYDEFSVDSYMNRILKTTMEMLLRYDIPKARKKELRNLLLYFKEVNMLDVHSINWNFRFHRNNQTYQMLMSICYLVIKGLLQTSSDGSMKLMQFLDEQRMCRLYEKFILEYYKKHYPQIKTSASQIGWALDDGIGIMLPIMQSDIMLVYGDRTLIIDAKYYSHTTQKQYNVNTLHSNNLYQIFTYVKNKAAVGGEVSGMLLYARTDKEIQPDHTYMMSGNRISVKTLDLNCDFREIARQLNAIADAFIA